MLILREEIFGPRVDICKITPPAARDDYLAANLGIVLNDKHLFPAPPCLKRAKQPGRTAADYDGVICHLCEITLVQDVDVVPHVPRRDISESPNGDRCAAGGANTPGAFFGDIF